MNDVEVGFQFGMVDDEVYVDGFLVGLGVEGDDVDVFVVVFFVVFVDFEYYGGGIWVVEYWMVLYFLIGVLGMWVIGIFY